MNMLTDIMSLSYDELCAFIVELGEKKFRAEQIFRWIHQKDITSFEQMTNISKELIQKLSESCFLDKLEPIITKTSQKDGTRKILYQMDDGECIETVFMTYKHGNSICISSQAGCRMGCKFCASTIGGLVRNLTPAQMLNQIYQTEVVTNQRISNVVVMGTGEPFDNYDNLMKFITILNAAEGRNIGQRSITVSTCGIIPKIMEFADANTQVNLAISLHAPTDELRKELMPIANKYALDDLIESCRYYTNKTHRRITFEYSLIQDVNDTKEMAQKLATLLEGMLCHVNLIPVNPVEGKTYKQSHSNAIENFQKALEKKGITTTLRRSLGTDVDAACGQLRRKKNEQSAK